MTGNHTRRIVVTYRDEHALANVQQMLDSEFMGLGKVYCGEDPRVLFLHPFPHIDDAVVRETLNELQSVGALTYAEEVR